MPEDDIARLGPAAIKLMRIEDPGAYVRVMANLIPKEILFQNSMTDMDDDSLDDLIVHIRERLLAARAEQPQLLEVKAIPNGRNSH